MSGLVPGILLGLAMMAVVKYYSKRKNFPKCDRVPFKEVCRRTFQSLPALLTPIILIGGIVSGLFTPTESAAFACIYALLVGIFFYKTIKVKNLPRNPDRDYEAVFPVSVRSGYSKCIRRVISILSVECNCTELLR